ncbi:MAG: glycoside hydrolase family 2 protein, partial [Christensenellales bacterium]
MNTIKALRFRLSALDEYGLDCSESFEAEVPGACQADYAKHLNLPDYKYSDNYKLYEFMEEKYFVYSAVLPEKNADKRTFLHLGGVDYRYEVFVDDEKIYAYEGMFKPCDVELTNLDFGNKTLKVLIFPVPKRADAKYGRWQADNVAKPPVSYGWDWHPRLIPSGIWKEAYIVEKDNSFIGEFKPVYKLSEDYKTAEVFPGAVFEGKGEYRMGLSLRGETVFSAVGRTDDIAPFTVKNPELWWPHCYGEQTMYDLSLEFSGDDGSSDKVEKSIGFRRSRLVTQDSNWYIDSFPFTQAKPPITLEINGKQIFGKGSNWVNPEIFFGKITRETYEPLLTLVKRANMNLLRVWGGSIVNKDSFFELCDRLGIMVWQEFPLACNCYRDDDRYLDVMRSESTAIIEQVRIHPSLVMWCGGNELYTGGSSMTEQFKVLRLLNSQCYLLDENTPFIMTSPL